MNKITGQILFFLTLSASLLGIQGSIEAGMLTSEMELNSSSSMQTEQVDAKNADDSVILQGFYNPEESSGSTSTGASSNTQPGSGSAVANTNTNLRDIEQVDLIAFDSTKLKPAPCLSTIYRPPIG